MTEPDAPRPEAGIFRELVLPDGTRWIDMDRRSPAVAQWLRDRADVPDSAAEAMLAEQTRPRCVWHEPARVLILRGVNLTEGSDPEDMLSLRVLVLPGLVATLHVGSVRSVADVAALVDGPSEIPRDTGELVLALAERLAERAEPYIDAMLDELDDLEDEIGRRRDFGDRCAALRRRASILRRYFGPQREALADLAGVRDPWMTDDVRHDAAELVSRVARFVEDLDATRERASIVADRLAAADAHRMNRTMYTLSLVAGVFLPISFVTGLLGMNVGGMPGIDRTDGFLIVCGMLAVVVVIEVWLFRRLRWL